MVRPHTPTCSPLDKLRIVDGLTALSSARLRKADVSAGLTGNARGEERE